MVNDDKLKRTSADINDFIKKKQRKNIDQKKRVTPPTPNEREILVPLDKLIDNPYQPRMVYDEQTIKGLAKSIASRGQIQSILVTPKENDYIIVVGHQRVRAMRMNNQTNIRATIKEGLNDDDLRIIAGMENVKRKNLDLIEEGRLYYDLIAHGYSIKEIAKEFGEDETTIGRKKNALKLPSEILDDIRINKSTGDLLALSKIRQIKEQKEQIRIYKDFLIYGRGWLKDEIAKIKSKSEHVQTVELPYEIKNKRLTLNLKGLNQDKISQIEEAIQNILK